jgi:hypothetical protein
VTLLHLFDGARLLSLECAVLWVPALLVGVAIGYWLNRCRRMHVTPKVVTDASGNTYPEMDGM